MLLLSNLISFTEELWIFLEVSSLIIRQVIQELPSRNTFLKYCSLACLISLFTVLQHFLNINQSHAFPDQMAFNLRTSLFIMHSFLQLRCDPG